MQLQIPTLVSNAILWFLSDVLTIRLSCFFLFFSKFVVCCATVCTCVCFVGVLFARSCAKLPDNKFVVVVVVVVAAAAAVDQSALDTSS